MHDGDNEDERVQGQQTCFFPLRGRVLFIRKERYDTTTASKSIEKSNQNPSCSINCFFFPVLFSSFRRKQPFCRFIFSKHLPAEPTRPTRV